MQYLVHFDIDLPPSMAKHPLFRPRVAAKASREEIIQLMRNTNLVAEIQTR